MNERDEWIEIKIKNQTEMNWTSIERTGWAERNYRSFTIKEKERESRKEIKMNELKIHVFLC